VSEPRGRTLPRRFGVLLAAVPLVAVLLFDAALVARHARPSTPSRTGTTHPSSSNSVAQTKERARADAITALLERRGHAVLHGNRREWLSTVDPSRPAFRLQQARAFDHMRDVPFASWTYAFDPLRVQPTPVPGDYHATTWAPAQFTLHYALRGFDAQPTSLPQYPTFVQRAGRWYLASLSDFDSVGLQSSLDLWDFGRVAVVRRARVLVLGHPKSVQTMQVVAAEVEADIPRVTAVWGPDWPRRAVVLVPATQHELMLVVDDYGDLDHIAAVATAEVQSNPGQPKPVGNRIGINPRNWPKLSPLGRRIVMTHELTHVATRSVTGGATPTWLAEGFADYVGYLGSGVPTTFAAQELARDVRAGKVPTRLPSESQFNGASSGLPQAYEGAWMACRLIVLRWGQHALVHFYRVVGTSPTSQDVAVASATRHVLHESASTFVRQWRAFLRRQLG